MTDISKYLNKIICGDCLSIMRDMPDESVDLFVTSPPYNLKNSTGNGLSTSTISGKWVSAAIKDGYSVYDDCMPYNEYVAWQRECLSEMFRLMKNDGAIFYNHKWRVQNGLLQDRHEILAGFPVRQIIIWRRKGGINFNPGYFLPTYEVIYLITKPEFRLAPKANAVGDVWEITQEMDNVHPAPFPVDLIKRIISSTTSQIIFDPFMGSGTTAIAAMELGRTYVGTETSQEYCDYAEKRLKEHKIILAERKKTEITYTKESLIEKLKEIAEKGWIPNTREGNSGSVGNILEDLLGIPENNHPIADAGNWEIKAQRKKSNCLTTMFHIEPSPRGAQFIPRIFLKKYSWKHKEAGEKYPETEKSFRQTLCHKYTDRGFNICWDSDNQKLKISFDATMVSEKHRNWLRSVEENVGLGELNPQPYWDYAELNRITKDKFPNCFYVKADTKRINGVCHFHYNEIYLLESFSMDKFLEELAKGDRVYIDIDARTGHNHGTKFRMKKNCLTDLYQTVTPIVSCPMPKDDEKN